MQHLIQEIHLEGKSIEEKVTIIVFHLKVSNAFSVSILSNILGSICNHVPKNGSPLEQLREVPPIN